MDNNYKLRGKYRDNWIKKNCVFYWMAATRERLIQLPSSLIISVSLILVSALFQRIDKWDDYCEPWSVGKSVNLMNYCTILFFSLCRRFDWINWWKTAIQNPSINRVIKPDALLWSKKTNISSLLPLYSIDYRRIYLSLSFFPVYAYLVFVCVNH